MPQPYHCPDCQAWLIRATDDPTHYYCPAGHRYELDPQGYPASQNLQSQPETEHHQRRIATLVVGRLKTGVLADTEQHAVDYLHHRLRRLLLHLEHEWDVDLNPDGTFKRFFDSQIELLSFVHHETEVLGDYDPPLDLDLNKSA